MSRQKKRTYVEIGSFLVTSDEIRVSDPSYDKNVKCCGVLKNMRPGKYRAFVAYCDDAIWGHRVEMLLIKHEGYRGRVSRANAVFSDDKHIHWNRDWNNPDIDVGVDSGQAGFFDERMYQQPLSILDEQDLVKKMGELTDAGRLEEASVIRDQLQSRLSELSNEYGDQWYTVCCHLTMSKQSAGVIPYGVVSSSGIGDGGYDCFVHQDSNGEGVMACLLYM